MIGFQLSKYRQIFFGLQSTKDIPRQLKISTFCGLYIPPSSSKYFDPELFEELEKDVLNFSSQGSILLLGDFNSRTGKYSDSVCHDGNNIIVNDQSESSFYPIRRNSYDNEINNHGKRLLDICKSAELKILNGRVWGDTLGTSHLPRKKWNKCYRLCNL